MSSKYRIFWIDDRPDWVEPIRDSIKDYLDDLGFTLIVELQQDGSKVTEFLASSEVDLIAVDYKLGKVNGDKIIEEIRQSDQYTEILFYTADQAPHKVLPACDGIYRASRPEVENKIKDLITLTLKRVQSPTNMRGSVIAETIDLENLVEETIIMYFGEEGERFKSRVLRKEGVYDFGKKYTLLMGLLKDQIKECNRNIGENRDDKDKVQALLGELTEIQDVLKKFEDKVINTRNILAHVQEQRDDKGRVVLKSKIKKSGKPIIIDHEWCVNIRKSLAEQRNALIGLLSINN